MTDIAIETTAPLSVAKSLQALKTGESFCLAKRLEQDHSTSEDIAAAAKALHDTARPAMARAVKATGFAFIGEQGEWRTNRGHNPVVSFLITRTA